MTDRRNRPTGLLVVLVALACLGLASLGMSALQYQASKAASRVQVDRNARLTVEVRRAAYEVCLAIQEVAVQVDLVPRECTPPSELEDDPSEAP